MEQYYVIAHDGNRYGPADIPTLQQWIQQNRILPSTMLENAETGQQLPASAISDLQFATQPVTPTTTPSPSFEVGQPQMPHQPAGPIYGRGAQVGFGGPGLQNFNNTSGMRADVPPEIESLKWNWGAFGCGCFWLLFHGLALAAVLMFFGLAFLGGMLGFIFGALRIPALGTISIVGYLIGLGVAIWLGMNGHKLAWRYNSYNSVEDYFQKEQIWMVLGIIVTAIALLGWVFNIVMAFTLRGISGGMPGG